MTNKLECTLRNNCSLGSSKVFMIVEILTQERIKRFSNLELVSDLLIIGKDCFNMSLVNASEIDHEIIIYIYK